MNNSEKVITSISDFQRKCKHNKILYDEALSSVECAICNEKLNPMWVIKQLSEKEHRAHRRIEDLTALADKAIAKTKCKCEHCGKITRIVR